MKRWMMFAAALLISGYGIYCYRHPDVPVLSASTKDLSFFYTMRVDETKRIYVYQQSGSLTGSTTEQAWKLLEALMQQPDALITSQPEEMLLDEGALLLRFAEPFLVEDDVRHWEALVANLIQLPDVQTVRVMVADRECEIPVTYNAYTVYPSSVEVFTRDLYQAMTLAALRMETVGDNRCPVLYAIRIPQTTRESALVKELTAAVSPLLHVKSIQTEQSTLIVDIDGSITDEKQITDRALLLCLGRSLAANLSYDAVTIQADGITCVTVYRNDIWGTDAQPEKKIDS